MTTLHLLDVSHTIHQMYHGLPKMARPSDNHPVGVVHGICRSFWRLIQEERPDYVAVVYDASGGSAWRKEAFPDYKANRKPIDDDLRRQLPLARQAAEVFGFARVEVPGQEADDLIATYCRLALLRDIDVRIHSSDKDVAQLVGDRVTMFDAKYEKTYTPAEVKDKWGVYPGQMADYLAMMGDASDNVPGVPGVGKMIAAQLLAEFGNLDAILQRPERIKRAAIQTAIRKNAWLARLSLSLTKLKDDLAVEQDINEFVYDGVDPAKILDFLDEMELVTLADDVRAAMPVAA